MTKKAGRPAKTAATAPVPTKKPGRPARATTTASEPPKKRGRPAKAHAEPEAEEESEVEEAEQDAAKDEPPKKRGRPGKQTAAANVEETATTTSAKKRGRPAKVKSDPAEAPAGLDTPAPRKRHSGRTGGPTTKIATDAAEAAEQLEDELMDEAKRSAKKGGKSKSSSSATKQDADDGGKNYWLMKAEQVDRMETLKNGSEFNTKFTIDDLKGKDAPEPWEGVRNMVARNNMRAMKQGDLAFFYASQGKAPGITGIIEVVREHEPDFTVTDESSIGYVEPAKRGKENQWSLVHVEFRKKLSEPVTLKQLQKFSAGSGVLKDMQVIKQSRLSVAKVSEQEWNFIVDNLIEGYEEEDVDTLDRAKRPTDNDDGLADVKVGDDLPLSTNLNGDQAVEGAYMDESENNLPSLPSVPAITGIVGSDENLTFTSGTALPTTTNATSRPTSRKGSRPASRAGSTRAMSRPTSRQGSRPVSRAGSHATAGSLAAPVFQTTESYMDVDASGIAAEGPGALQSASPIARAASVKPGVSSRASSRAPSRASSLQPAMRGSSLEPSARPVSRARSKTPNFGAKPLMPSLMESPADA